MSLAGWFVDICSGLCNPVVLQVPPMTAHRIAMNGANVVVNAQLGAGETFQHDAESTRHDVQAARLEPYTFRIRNTIHLAHATGADLLQHPIVGKALTNEPRWRERPDILSKPAAIHDALGAVGGKRLSGSHHVLALHKAARVLTRRHVRE
jgi:hypothetical protein